MSDRIKVTGDVIEFDGYEIARIRTHGIPPTTRGRFEATIDNEREDPDKIIPQRMIFDVLKLREKVEAGFIAVEDFDTMVRDLKGTYL